MITLLSVLTVFFVIVALFLGLLVLIQQGKGDMGLGGLGASSQMLFGGSGGQDFFEKITWTFGFIFMFGALGLAHMKSRALNSSKVASKKSNRVLTYQNEAASKNTVQDSSTDATTKDSQDSEEVAE